MIDPRSSVYVCDRGHRWPGARSGSTVPEAGARCPECGGAARVLPASTEGTRGEGGEGGGGSTEADPFATYRGNPYSSQSPTAPSLWPERPPEPSPPTLPPAPGPATEPAASPVSPSPRPRRSEANPTVAGYTVLGELGRGAMGVVYKARHERLKRPVALKMIRVDPLYGPQFLEHFQAEAEAVARLRHPNVVQIYEVGEHEGLPFLALEFVTGGTLKKRLDGKPQPARAAAQFVEVLALAVHAGHLRGIVHRDLKPANILLEPAPPAHDPGGDGDDPREASRYYGVPKISDFGLAKRIDEHSEPVGGGEVVGTPLYMSPEQALGQTEDVGPASDIYALGAILFEMLTGRPPFRGRSVAEVLRQVADDDPFARVKGQAAVKLPRDLEAVCRKCLEKEPRLRYPSAAALADDLHRFREGRPVRARPSNALSRSWRWSLRYPFPASLVVAVCAVLGVAQWRLHELSGGIVARTALANATQQTATLKKMNSLYAKVAGRVRDAGDSPLVLTHEYPSTPHSVPIPVRLLIMLGEEMEALADSSSGGGDKGNLYPKLHVYSNHPFRYRPGNPPPPKSFGADALDHFRDNPASKNEPFFRTETDQDDRRLMRYATAFVMERPCLGCHNDPSKYDESYRDQARTDWKSGDVRGALVVDIPLTREYRRTKEEVYGTYLLMAGTAAATLSLSWLLLTLAGRRGR